MKRISWGNGFYDLHYNAGHMSTSMRILQCRLGQILYEDGKRDLYLKGASFVFFNKTGIGGDKGWQFLIPEYHNRKNINEYHLNGSIKEFYKNGLEIYLEDDYFCKRQLEPKHICKKCKGRKYIREDAWGFIEICKNCNSNYFLTFAI